MLYLLEMSVFIFISVAFVLCTKWYFERNNETHRIIACATTFTFTLMYIHWRLFSTVIPVVTTQSLIEVTWTLIVFFIEILMFIEISLFLLIMSRYNNRSNTKHNPITHYPSVDVYIPTYDEPLDVLEKSIIGARNLDYPNFKVWVLDDSNREWLKEYCENKNVGYLTRNDNLHAKAGNMNNALAHTNGDFIAVFDADFVPSRNFITKTIPYFIEDDSIGIVQTPQTFFNKDTIQSNLNLHMEIPDEQRLFFEEMAPSRDAWNAAFCCGSCSIIRRKHLDDIGGFPTESITEDLLTTLSMLSKGYRTIYHNETLSRGLASQSVDGYFVQRERWCQGGIQCMYLSNGPLRMKGLSFLQRILFLPYGWIIQPLTRIFVLLIPIVYLLFGLPPIQFIEFNDILTYFIPMVIVLTYTNIWLTGKKYLPLLNVAIGMFSTFRMLNVTVQSIFKPFNKPFKVTPKGSNNKEGKFDTVTLLMSLTFFFITLTGIIINMRPEWSRLDSIYFFPYALVWASLNLLYLLICILLSFDFKSSRKEERFDTSNSTVMYKGNEYRLKDTSISGFCSEKIKNLEKGEIAKFTLFSNDSDKSIVLDAKVINSFSFTTAEFIFSNETSRDRLIEILFSGDFDNSVKKYESSTTLINKLWKRINDYYI